MRDPNESQRVMELMHAMKNEIAELKAKVAEQASQHGSNCISSEGTRQNGVPSTLGDANSICNSEMPIKHAPPITPHGTPTSVVSKLPVPISLVGATNSHNAQISNSGIPIEHAPPITPHGTRISVVSKPPLPISIVGATNSLNAQLSNSGMPIEHVPPKTPQGTRIPVFSKEMSLNATTTSNLPKVARILPYAIQQPSHKRNVEQFEANSRPHEIGQIKRMKNAELNYLELEKLINKILMENPEIVKKFIRGDKSKREMSHCQLAGMALYMSKKRANIQMLDNLLRDKLNKVATKECVRHSQA